MDYFCLDQNVSFQEIFVCLILNRNALTITRAERSRTTMRESMSSAAGVLRAEASFAVTFAPTPSARNASSATWDAAPSPP